ncbi:hypothetical protein [Nocardia pneumoniae]|uniref:hypothetical protein n=1 Tax=Nocardia pneumoniae TaxID=228601 RepID=UPI00031E6F65
MLFNNSYQAFYYQAAILAGPLVGRGVMALDLRVAAGAAAAMFANPMTAEGRTRQ